jgi:sucrose phosphorylase
MTARPSVLDHLVALYGEAAGRAAFDRLRARLTPYLRPLPPLLTQNVRRGGRGGAAGEGGEGDLTHRDAILITYGDQFRKPGEAPLRTLADFARRHFKGLISAIHILPFYPYSSDDGFSVIDYRAVDPALGAWGDVQRIGDNFRLMFDAVVNHVSASSEWFRRFLQDDPIYRDWFITVDPRIDLTQVVRPRALPLLTPFDTPPGPKHVWTTFSADQIDLNYASPDVLLEMIDLLLFYVSRGAQFIRLDAIAYLWKEIGTPCIHLPQTHRVIQLFRAVLDEVAPHVVLITETNVPHVDNVSYFGGGKDEAQMVYNFALPPLVLHAFHTGDARTLSRWAASLTSPDGFLKPVGASATFFNFLASHDGIGLSPARDILSEAHVDRLVERAQAHGGFVSMKANSDGTRSPYELNINYFDALNDPNASEPLETQVDRFMCAQAIMLSLAGAPGIYVHSLLGSRGWPEGVKQTGRYRAINRQKLDAETLVRELADPHSLRARVFRRYASLLKARAAHSAFDPYGSQRLSEDEGAVFTVLRSARDGSEDVLCLHNVSSHPQPCQFRLESTRAAVDLLTGRTFEIEGVLHLNAEPYEVLWLALTH